MRLSAHTHLAAASRKRRGPRCDHPVTPYTRRILASNAPAQPTSRRSNQALLIAVVAVVIAVVTVAYINKASKGKTAFLRWAPQVTQLVQGQDIYAMHAYPNTPVVALLLYPLAQWPPLAGAIALFAIKLAMAAAAIGWSIRLAAGQRAAPPLWAVGVVLALAARPIISDLQHGNINIVVLYLVTLGLWLFARDRLFLGGFWIGFAVVVKVTPALLVLYFAWKRQWMLLIGAAAGALAGVLLPALVLGMDRNIDLHRAWYDQMISRYVVEAEVEIAGHINQSIPGLMTRLLTDTAGLKLGTARERAGEDAPAINLVSLESSQVEWAIRIVLLAILGWLAFVCRTPVAAAGERRQWRLACEMGLVLLAMLLMSERTWKHHFVIVVLPIASLVMHLALRSPPRIESRIVIAALIGYALLTMATSGELIGWMYKGIAHKYVEAFGSFMLAAILLFAAISFILLRQRRLRLSAAPPALEPTARDTGRTSAAPPQ